MENIVISASTKHYAEMNLFAERLRNHGVKVYAPSLVQAEGSSASTLAKHQLAMINRHNDEIDKCDVLFVYNPTGYVGVSVTIEIGYALAKGKLIIAKENDPELGRSVLYAAICNDTDQLINFLQNNFRA